MIYSWKRIIRHSLPLLTACIFIEIFAGQILQGKQELLVLFPIYLITIPVINGVGGNIGSILGARLASGLHVGYITYNIKDKEMHENLLVTILIGVITYLFLAIVIYFVAVFGNLQKGINFMEFARFISVVLGTGVLLVLTVSIVSIFTAFVSFKRGLDPDDMVSPVVTTVGDTMGIIFLFILIGVVGI